mmetsp:Transcript_61029/g.189525  ORF Transcript_61029/g.189525 Transcript_61029/m.189525 type:complete len:258 (+) Transcript_61029:1625-2398(+)
MLAMPVNLLGRCPVQDKPERRFAFPHLACHIVTASEFIREALAAGVKHEATDAAKRLGGQKLDLCIRVIRLDEARWMHLHPFQIDGLGADSLAHLDSITRAMLTVCSWQVHQVRPVLGEQRLLRKISTETTTGEDDWSVLLEIHATLLVNEADTRTTAVGKQFGRARLGDDASFVGFLRNLFHHLDQRIRDCHAWETFLSPVSPRSRVAAKARDQRQVEIELVHQPIDISAAVPTEHFHYVRLFRASLERVRREQLH